MKKVFISIPMNGRDNNEVQKAMMDALEDAKAQTGEELVMIDSFLKNDIPENAGRCWFLGDSIKLMDEADYVYFTGDWWNGNGCVIEHMAAELYGKAILYDNSQNSKGFNWAKNETYLAIKEAGEDDESAKRAFQAAFAGFHMFLNKSDISDDKGWDLGVAALRQLTNRLPLTSLNNDPDDWIEGEKDEEGKRYFVHKRLDTLWKMIDTNGNEHFVDTERVHCIDIHDSQKRYYHGGLGETIFNRVVPITFPYYPNGVYTVYTEEFKAYEDAEENDTFGVIGIKHPTTGEMAEVMQFLKKNHKTGDWDYISRTEYASRMKKAQAIKKKETAKLFAGARKEKKNGTVSGENS